jgi:ABC-2 type transport system ATP-binding protein
MEEMASLTQTMLDMATRMNDLVGQQWNGIINKATESVITAHPLFFTCIFVRTLGEDIIWVLSLKMIILTGKNGVYYCQRRKFMEKPLTVTNLSKKFNEYYALSPVSFSLDGGEITALCGPNGSGKTTLLTCIAGLTQFTSGSVQVNGFDMFEDEVEFRKRLVFVPDVPRYYLELTAWEHLEFIAAAHHNQPYLDKNGKSLLENLALWDARNLFPHHFSRGMRLKLALAMAFIRPFDVLLLDEPTSALDESGIKILISQLMECKEKGKTVLFSTHDQILAEKLTNRKMTISQGVMESE